MTLSNYMGAGNRRALNWQWFKPLGVSKEWVRQTLKDRFGAVALDVDIVELARSLVGKTQFRYQLGAHQSSAPELVDCSSLMVYLYGRCGIKIPRMSLEQRRLAEGIRFYEAAPGDLVFASNGHSDYYDDDESDGVGHVGMITNTGTIIHAVNVCPEKCFRAEKDEIGEFLAVQEIPLEEFFDTGFVPRGVGRILPPAEDLLIVEVPEGWEYDYAREIVLRCSTFVGVESVFVDKSAAA